MLQASDVDAIALSDPTSAMSSPHLPQMLADDADALRSSSRDSSRGRAVDSKATNIVGGSSAASPVMSRTTSTARTNQPSTA
nr:hypothetical protein [Tanacetum cinerariifolium]